MKKENGCQNCFSMFVYQEGSLYLRNTISSLQMPHVKEAFIPTARHVLRL